MKKPERIPFWWKVYTHCPNLFTVVYTIFTETAMSSFQIRHHFVAPRSIIAVQNRFQIHFQCKWKVLGQNKLQCVYQTLCQQSKVCLQPNLGWIRMHAPKIELIPAGIIHQQESSHPWTIHTAAKRKISLIKRWAVWSKISITFFFFPECAFLWFKFSSQRQVHFHQIFRIKAVNVVW